MSFQRVSKDRPCPVCRKITWCLVASDGGAAICPRTPSARRVGEAGWLHQLKQSPENWRPRPRGITIPLSRPSYPDLGSLAEGFVTAVDADALTALAGTLGLSVAILKRFGVGWTDRYGGAWTFPMRDAACHVIGFRLRLVSGRKLSWTGGHEGLFVPSGLRGHELLLIAEGPTDTAALLDLGLDAIGRPSCTGGVRLLAELVKARKPAGVVVVADGDEPGQRGANALASALVLHVRRLRIIGPPEGVKDARAWKQTGATAADVRAAIDAAPIRKLNIINGSTNR